MPEANRYNRYRNKELLFIFERVIGGVEANLSM